MEGVILGITIVLAKEQREMIGNYLYVCNLMGGFAFSTAYACPQGIGLDNGASWGYAAIRGKWLLKPCVIM